VELLRRFGAGPVLLREVRRDLVVIVGHMYA
jgi:hypothetical protein